MHVNMRTSNIEYFLKMCVPKSLEPLLFIDISTFESSELREMKLGTLEVLQAWSLGSFSSWNLEILDLGNLETLE